MNPHDISDIQTKKSPQKVLNPLSIILLVILVAIISSVITYLLINKNNTVSTNTDTNNPNLTTPPVSTIVPTTATTSPLKTYMDPTGWQINYPSNWSQSSEVNSSGMTVQDFQSPQSDLTTTSHQARFLISDQQGSLLKTYDDCMDALKNGGYGGAAGTSGTKPEQFKIGNYDACRYTTTNTDGIVYNINTVVFVKDSTSGKMITFSYGESNGTAGHDYTSDKWIYSDVFTTILNSFKFGN